MTVSPGRPDGEMEKVECIYVPMTDEQGGVILEALERRFDAAPADPNYHVGVEVGAKITYLLESDYLGRTPRRPDEHAVQYEWQQYAMLLEQELERIKSEGWLSFTEEEKRGIGLGLTLGVPNPMPPEIESALSKLRGSGGGND